MYHIIENVAGKGTQLCKTLQNAYAICEGAVRNDTKSAYDLLNQRYGTDGRPDPAKIADSVGILVDNDHQLYDMLHNMRTSARGVAWLSMMQELNAFLEFMESKPLSSEQFKNWFQMSGMTLDEGMGLSVSVIEKKRKAIASGEE